MVLTIKQVILSRSEFNVGVDGTITQERLDVLEVMATNRLNNLIGSRTFSGDQLIEMKGLLVCDMLKNKSGKGVIVQESVKENSWRANVRSSSYYMDEVLAIIRDSDKKVNTEITTTAVHRSDSYKDGIIDGKPYRGDQEEYHPTHTHHNHLRGVL
jgi:hypothetical protein